ncbi:MAG: hypothetical protein H5U20_08275, partial [Rhodobacteraceae bacterium]|nr:hypothetical protein [Paracoccaceae bacterium]
GDHRNYPADDLVQQVYGANDHGPSRHAQAYYPDKGRKQEEERGENRNFAIAERYVTAFPGWFVGARHLSGLPFSRGCGKCAQSSLEPRRACRSPIPPGCRDRGVTGSGDRGAFHASLVRRG